MNTLAQALLAPLRPFSAGIALLLSGCQPWTSLTSAQTSNALEPEQTITVFGMFVGEHQAQFERSLIPFEEATGIDVIYEGDEAFPQLIEERVAAGQAPDIAIFPQPALIAQFAEQGQLVPLTQFMDRAQLRRAYSDTWTDLVSFEDAPYAIWLRASVKSLVWYRPSAFSSRGYDIPQTWEELIQLSERIVSEGGTPWCIGLESGEATGWPGTDWIEDIMLRTAGPEAYQQWVDHRLPFSSPPVLNSMRSFSQILHQPDFVDGKASGTVNKPYGPTALGIFNEPPDCYLYRQASFVSAYFPPDKAARVDYDVFPFPSMDARFGTPILVAGDALGMFHDTSATRALAEYFMTREAHEALTQESGFISPHNQFDGAQYSDLVTQKIAQILSETDVIRFDGSDMMPKEVGTDRFWREMVLFAEGKSPEAIAQDIDANWPQP